MAELDDVVFALDAAQFGTKERVLAAQGELVVSGFRYGSGVAALRIANAAGEMIVLPWLGQQIWDASFHGRRLTMGSIFEEPVPNASYVGNYGGFLLHCGITAIGNPAPEDTHPVHGELPNAAMHSAELRFGTDGEGPYVRVGGTRTERQAFGTHYAFASMLTLRPGSGRIGAEVAVTNHRAKPMELMYLAHVNFRPVDGARIVDAVPDDAAHFRVRRHMPIYTEGAPEYRAQMDGFAADPATHRQIVAGRRVDPELVAGMDFPAGADGWAHALQVLPDGASDFVSFRPDELKNCVRWMTRNGDEDALGLALPATAEADGRIAERRKGNVQMLAPAATWRARMAFGALDTVETAALQAEIDRTRGQGGRDAALG